MNKEEMNELMKLLYDLVHCVAIIGHLNALEREELYYHFDEFQKLVNKRTYSNE